MRITALCLALVLPLGAVAGSAEITRDVVEHHILPRMAALKTGGAELSEAAKASCQPDDEALRDAFGAAFDAWISASHLRFGPTEAGDRAYALAFWPDTRGLTPRTLRSLIEDADPVAERLEDYADVSIAARGFYALERMLYDPDLQTPGDAGYRCTLMRAISADIAVVTADIAVDWQEDYAQAMENPGDGSPYHTSKEAIQELFKALSYGLEFTADTRLGRPLGTFDAPRPNRAEARRSGRSLRHVALSLDALADLAVRLAADDPKVADSLEAEFSVAIEDAAKLDDPVFAGVADPRARLRGESLQQSIRNARAVVRGDLGPLLGVASGFNAMDGD